MRSHGAAPAKVNLTLEVLGRRPDGYHALRSLVVFTAIGDVLRMGAPDDRLPRCNSSTSALGAALTEPCSAGADGAGAADQPRCTVGGPFQNALADTPARDNLVVKALIAWCAATGSSPSALPSFELIKNLPVAAGIGGGSSDAAAALRLCQTWATENAGWAPMDAADLHALALRLGADVPVCLASTPAMMEGIGEILTPVDLRSDIPAVLVNPGIAVPTGPVFKALAATQLGPGAQPHSPHQSGEAPCFRTLEDLLAYTAARPNDLEAPALRLAPAMAAVRDALGTTGARLVRMSGSGATWFGLYDTHDQASAAGATIRAAHPAWWVQPTTIERTPHGPGHLQA
ncbi:MAG: 4-(cytidine 5'-diphospho)-2-C-methyl-D-erythritol kinase [Pseudomonadota bacterium]